MEKVELAPIVLFAYARPEHTLRTLQALAANTLASQSRLYIYVDGVKKGASDDVVKRNAEVREVVWSQQWCGEVVVREQTENKGLAASIRDGVTDVLQQNGKVIVVEDDLVTSPAFLSYKNTSQITLPSR